MISDSRPRREHGGLRSGAGRPRLRASVDDYPSISVLSLHGAGRISPTAQEVTVFTQNVAQTVQVTHTPCPLGGSRPWFTCPRCERRVGVLYLRTEPSLEVSIQGQRSVMLPERHALACRNCLKLQYASQSEDATQRSLRRTRKLGAKLSAVNSHQKPKWMRWATFEQLCLAIKNERELRTAVRHLTSRGVSVRDAELHSEIALAASRSAQLTDQELGRALGRVSLWRRRKDR